MKILNEKNPDVAAKLFPWYVPTEGQTRMDIAAQLYHMLEERPDDTLVLVAIERNIARGVVIAHIAGKRRKRHAWIWQANSTPGFTQGKMMLEGVKTWAKKKGCKQIRMNNTDESKDKFFNRIYGFERKGREMVCHV